MKAFAFLALLLVGGAAFYFMDGAEKFGLIQPAELPETIDAPNATFLGDEQANPFAE